MDIDVAQRCLGEVDVQPLRDEILAQDPRLCSGQLAVHLPIEIGVLVRSLDGSRVEVVFIERVLVLGMRHRTCFIPKFKPTRPSLSASRTATVPAGSP